MRTSSKRPERGKPLEEGEWPKSNSNFCFFPLRPLLEARFNEGGGGRRGGQQSQFWGQPGEGRRAQAGGPNIYASIKVVA